MRGDPIYIPIPPGAEVKQHWQGQATEGERDEFAAPLKNAAESLANKRVTYARIFKFLEPRAKIWTSVADVVKGTGIVSGIAAGTLARMNDRKEVLRTGEKRRYKYKLNPVFLNG